MEIKDKLEKELKFLQKISLHGCIPSPVPASNDCFLEKAYCGVCENIYKVFDVDLIVYHENRAGGECRGSRTIPLGYEQECPECNAVCYVSSYDDRYLGHMLPNGRWCKNSGGFC